MELAESIQDSFHSKHNITFNFNLPGIRLLTADTVPLGLILNEAITNCVKYAFNEGEQGIITISMSETSEGQCQLTVRDNGKGLPDGFDVASCTSLGINLMIGLTEQLNGKFNIDSNKGTVVSVIFHPSSAEMRL